jgi:hypothetical protein
MFITYNIDSIFVMPWLMNSTVSVLQCTLNFLYLSCSVKWSLKPWLKPLLHIPGSDAGCEIVVVRGDPASLISNAGVNTGLFAVVTRTMTVFYTDEHGTYLERPWSVPAWSRSVRSLLVLTRLIQGRPQINKIFLCCVDIRGHPWLAVYCPGPIRVQYVYIHARL